MTAPARQGSLTVAPTDDDRRALVSGPVPDRPDGSAVGPGCVKRSVWRDSLDKIPRDFAGDDARLVGEWISRIGLDPLKFGTHSLRQTKATLIYRRTRNLRAVQLLLGHRKIESTVRYLGIEIDDAIEIAEKIDV
jgi:hypothetical protein